MDISKYLTKEIKIPEWVDRAAIGIYKYPAAISFGMANVIIESPLTHLIRKNLRPDMPNEDYGNFIQRFNHGYRTGIEVFNSALEK